MFPITIDFYSKPGEEFLFKDGYTAKSLKQLLEHIKILEYNTFISHVNIERNDFYNWINHSLKLYSLANSIKEKKSQYEIIKEIELYLDYANKGKRIEEDFNEYYKKHNNLLDADLIVDTGKYEKENYEETPIHVEEIKMPIEEEVKKTEEKTIREESKKEEKTKEEKQKESKKIEEEKKEDDLTRIEGIGEKTEKILKKYGIKTYNDLSNMKVEELKAILQENNIIQNPNTWPEQAKLAKEEKRIQLKEWQEKLRGGIEHKTEETKEKTIEEKTQDTMNNITTEKKLEITEEEKQKYSSKEAKITEEEVKEYARILDETRKTINKVFIGQPEVVERVLLALLCDAHALLEGVPGLAKSLLVETLGHVIGGTTFRRIQFLPDMLPADILGTEIYNPKDASFHIVKGPIFANFILADEINRAPPKTHAALMEAMQERKINLADEEFILDKPFLVLATQNPLENKGTYALPEAVLDRFMFKIDLDYPERKYEKIIITENATTKKNVFSLLKVTLTKEQLLEMQKKVREVYISERIRDYILDIVEATRGVNKKIQGAKFIKYGGGPRATIYLGIGAKARALMQGRTYVLPEDVMYVAPDILRHRIALNFIGKAHEIKTDRIVEEILTKVNPI